MKQALASLKRFGPIVAVGIVAAAGLICQSCEDDANPLGVSDVVFPDSAVSFSTHVERLFHQSCASSLCHGGGDPASQLSLEAPAYRALIDHKPTLVHPGDGENSLLYLRVAGQVGDRMPLRMTPLNDNQIQGIKRWIDEGAVNN